jgi:hypothetical protein
MKRNILRPHRRSARHIDRDLDEIIRPQPYAGITVFAINEHLICLYQIAKIHPAQGVKPSKEIIVQPNTSEAALDLKMLVFNIQDV